MKYVYLSATGKRITLRAYVESWKRAKRIAKDNPKAEVVHGLNGWWPITVTELLREYRQAMHDRINQGIPYCERGLI